MADDTPRWQQVGLVGRHLEIELCQFLFLLRLVTVIAVLFRLDGWDDSELTLLALSAAGPVVATFWLPRLVDSVRSHPLVVGADVGLVAGVLYVSGNADVFFMISLFSAALIGLLYRGIPAAMLMVVLVGSYLVACTRQDPLPSATEWLSSVGVYGAVYLASSILQNRVRQLTDYGMAASRSASMLAERERLAREMHDGVVKTLHGLALTAAGLVRSGRVPDDISGQLTVFAEAAEYGVQQARETLVELRVDQDDRPLVVVIEEIVGRWSERAGIGAEFTATGVVDLGVDVRTELLACLREALDNVAEHAGAEQVRVRLELHGHELVLSVTDNGRGLESSRLRAARRQGHFGVAGMQERMAAVGGRCEVGKAAPRGTTIRCVVPVRLG